MVWPLRLVRFFQSMRSVLPLIRFFNVPIQDAEKKGIMGLSFQVMKMKLEFGRPYDRRSLTTKSKPVVLVL